MKKFSMYCVYILLLGNIYTTQYASINQTDDSVLYHSTELDSPARHAEWEKLQKDDVLQAISAAHPTETLIVTEQPLIQPAVVMIEEDAMDIVVAPEVVLPDEYMAHIEENIDTILFESQELSPLCYALPEGDTASEPLVFTQTKYFTQAEKTEWLVLILMAADNDLGIFAARNIKQMAMAGSNKNVRIVVHLDIKLNNNYKVTRRYLVEKNKITHLNVHDTLTQRMDSGDPKTLISFCEYAIQNFPANKRALIFWDHATGALDPERGRIIDPSTFFVFNKETQKLELDRSIGYFEALERCHNDKRGICWDDSTNNYLTNQKLIYALDDIYNRVLKGKKFNIIGFDACLMSMVEIANIIKKYANIMVGSEEVELGTGWRYNDFLVPLSERNMSQEELANAIVAAYDATYRTVTEDYTLSAIKLQHIPVLETSINNVAKLLNKCIAQQMHNSVSNSIKASRNKLLCTHFDEPSYVDLHHLCTNLLNNLNHFVLNSAEQSKTLLKSLKQALAETKTSIEKAVLSYCNGSKLNKARGLSIYFPERNIFKSYSTLPFAQNSDWLTFLKTYLMY